MNNPNINFYHQNAQQQAELYDGQSFEGVHAHWADLLDALPANARVCDIGAGSGRDAAALTARGLSVYAVEPAKAMREIGMQRAPQAVWMDDHLPEMNQLLLANAHPYDLILISGVWMHLNADEQQHALHVMAEVVSEDGYLVISLRQGQFSDGRTTSNPTLSQLKSQADEAGFNIVRHQGTKDSLGRSDVSWCTVVLSLRT
jgi:2-polyprenyl-3-methyl-5-hydroxy-6-metoxy-1,4-benzoquinol methylase